MATEFKKGSEWRKWDLHFHTPSSHDYKDAGVTNQQIIDELVSKEIAVVAITDHHTIDVNRIIDLQNLAGSQITILPGIEFCSELGGSESIHFIGILPNNVDLQSLWTKVQGRLGLTDADIEQRGGYEHIQCDLIDTCDLIHELGGVTTIHAGTKTNTVENIKNTLLAKMQQKRRILSDSIDILEIGKENDVDSYKTMVFPNIGFKLPLIVCSDNHDIKNYISKQNLWIKADPTFEGLKQILYEPEERVRIQENKPEEKAGYHVIEKVILNEDNFWKEELSFNSNLNTIIGGRSTGKSTLLQSIAKKIDTEIESNDFVNEHLDSIEVIWQDGELNSARDIEFFPQSHMYKIADNPSDLNVLVHKIVKNKDVHATLARYNEFVGQNKLNISALVNEAFLLQASVNSKKSELKEKGDKTGIEAEIRNLDAKLQNLKSDANISDETLEQYRELTKSIAERAEKIIQADKGKTELSAIRDKNIINESLYFDLIRLREVTRDTIEISLKGLIEEVKEKWQRIIDSSIETLQSEIQTIHRSIEKDKEGNIYITGFQYTQVNKEYSEIQKKIEEERKKLTIILELEKQIGILNKQLDELTQKIIQLHNLYLTETNSAIEKLRFEYEGIEITSKINYRKDNFRLFLESRHNRRSFDNQEYYEDIINNYTNDLTSKIYIYLRSSLSGNIEYKGGHQANNVTNEFLSTNWFDIEFELKYQNDLFHAMSQGKQAFVILKLLLDFSDKKCPILIDQPEDSLDNRAIYNELVQYIKKKKKERQIILVTHNPNVVVSADSELVIVANQHGKDSKNRDEIKFQYMEGSLENTFQKVHSNTIILESQGIREHVCEILEGGKEAFEKREEKYGFK